MSVLSQTLASLRLPDFMGDHGRLPRKHIADLLAREEYGVIPDVPFSMEAEIVKVDDRFCAGKCVLTTAELTIRLAQGECRFPVRLAMPKAEGSHPLFVFINFRPEVPDRYLPSEEICDRGYAVLSFYYNDVSLDADDGFKDGLALLLRCAAAENGVPQEQLPGKIAVWAWAMSRALDWALTQPQACPARIAVIGHSRLGKTALWCGLQDERFTCVISNDSGCSGAAITRGKPGEHIVNIIKNFPFWFCPNYLRYADKEDALPFEQDWLLAGIAPRLVAVGSAVEDEWAGPSHEYLSCVSAAKAWEKDGFVHPDRLPVAGDVLHEGSIGYHLRAGCHYLGREDWNHYMDFLDAKGWHCRAMPPQLLYRLGNRYRSRQSAPFPKHGGRAWQAPARQHRHHRGRRKLPSAGQ